MSAGESVPAQEVTFDSVPGFFDSYDMEQAINIPVTNPGDVLNLPLRFADWHDVPYEMSSPKAQDSFDLRVNPAPIQQQNENFPQTQDRRLHRVISINVNTLLQNLVSSVVCLGRAPGIRPSDVEAAIWTAVREAILV